MKVVVTGGSGNIGRYVVRELLQYGHEIVSFDRVVPPEPEPGVHYRLGDHEDEGTIFELLAPAEAVVHLSAIPSPGTHANAFVFRTNVMGTYNVCEAAATLGLRKIVATSSINVLGMGFRYRDFVPHYLPVDENHPDLPQDPYGLSKVVGEDIVDMVHRRTGIPAVSIRPSHVIVPENWPERLAAMEADFNAYYRGIWGYSDVRDLAVGFRLALGNGRRRARRVLHRGRRRILSDASRRSRTTYLSRHRADGRPPHRHGIGYHQRQGKARPRLSTAILLARLCLGSATCWCTYGNP